MSNNSAAGETTPLRRPESRNSSDVSSPSLLLTKSRDVEKNYRNPNHNCNKGKSTNSGQTSSTTLSRTATVAVANLNNNNVEVRLGEDPREESTCEHVSKAIIMDHNKRMFQRVALDVFILLCVGFPILCFYLWGSAYQRGFFCDDESLKHPFKDSTVRNWMLYIIGLVIPVGVVQAHCTNAPSGLNTRRDFTRQNSRKRIGETMATCRSVCGSDVFVYDVEIVRAEHSKSPTDGNLPYRRYSFMDYEIPAWMVECYKKIGVFAFGAAACQMTTDIAKYSIGRLRPHFFAVCQPILSDGTTCSDPQNVGRYIEEFTCKGDDATKRMLKEVRLSFPSGHSSFTFFTMVYTALYLQSRMNWHGSKLLRHFLQFLFIMIAWYTALSRVSDYKHHWSDVLAGSTIGSLVALIVANCVSDLFQRKSTQQYLLPRTSQDAQPQTISSNGH